MHKHKEGDFVWVMAVVDAVDRESKYYPYKIDFGDDSALWISSGITIAKESEIVYTKDESFKFGDNVVVTIGHDTIEGVYVADSETSFDHAIILVNGRVRHYPKEDVRHG